MKKIGKGICLLFLLPFAVGCSLLESNTSLMKPPALPDAEQEILSALHQHISSTNEWLVPLNEKQSNPIILKDLNGDGQEEAIAFYKENTGTIKGIILEKKETWQKWTEISGEGKYLYDLAFFDMDGDGIKEVFMGTSYAKTENSSRILFVYTIQDGAKKLLAESYRYFLVDQFGPTGSALALIQFQRNTENTVSLYQMEQGDLSMTDTLSLDPYMIDYRRLTSGKISPNTWGMVFDAGVGAYSGRTFMIAVEDGLLRNVFSGRGEFVEKDLTFKTSLASSEDTNEDGILEYAVLEVPIEEAYSTADKPYLTVYYQLDETEEPEVVSRAFYNDTFHYKVFIPLDWPAVSIQKSDDWRQLEIIQNSNDTVLFDVYVTNTKHTGEGLVLEETDQYVYFSKTGMKKYQDLFELVDYK